MYGFWAGTRPGRGVVWSGDYSTNDWSVTMLMKTLV